MIPGRRLQLLSDRAGKRWARRHKARMAKGADRDALRPLVDEAEALFRKINDLAPADPILGQLAKAQELEDARPNPDDPDDD